MKRSQDQCQHGKPAVCRKQRGERHKGIDVAGRAGRIINVVADQHRPALEVVLRDAQPTGRELENDPDAQERQARAMERLSSDYRAAKTRGTLHKLDPRIRNLCERYEAEFGHLPKSKGGRPPNAHRRLLIAFTLDEEIKARGPGWGNLESALWAVVARLGVDYDEVKDIHYDIVRGRDPELVRDIEIERAHRKHFEKG
jgi:hypothetical protein